MLETQGGNTGRELPTVKRTLSAKRHGKANMGRLPGRRPLEIIVNFVLTLTAGRPACVQFCMPGSSEPGGGSAFGVGAGAKSIARARPAPVADANISKIILCDKTIICVSLFVCARICMI